MASSNVVETYAHSVVAGDVLAGKYHRLACQRHLSDLARQRTPAFPYVFVLDQAERFFRFAEKLKHYKGEWAGQPIVLSDFQRFRLGCIFGWRHAITGTRRFTTAYNEIPRKNGKTLEAAAVALYCTFFESEPGAEGYCLATKEKQATDFVFRDAKRLVVSSGLKAKIKVNAKNLYRADTESKLEPLGSDSDTTDGLNPHLIVTDELHAWKTRGLLDVVETATGARRNPMHYQITTAGDNPVSPCGDQHDYACKVLDGLFDDLSSQTFFACIAHADTEDDWLDERTWRKANPHYGISVKPDDIEKLALKAKAMPSAAAEFKQKRLNIWINADDPWLSHDGWRKGQSSWLEDEMVGQPCWAGVDLSSKIDLTAVSLVFPPTASRQSWRVILRAFTPADTLVERARRDRAPYDIWREQGWLEAPDGRSLDYDRVLDEIEALRKRFKIQAIGFDPYNAENLERDLQRDCGFGENQVIEIPQTFQFMSPPSKDVEADVLEERMDARQNPVLAWAVSNAVVQRDGKDNIQPIKKRSRGRIDPLVATIIARAVHKRLGVTARRPRGAPKVWTPDGWRPADGSDDARQARA